MPLLVLAGVLPLVSAAVWLVTWNASAKIHTETKDSLARNAFMLGNSISQWDQLNLLALENLAIQPDIVSMDPQQQKPALKLLQTTYGQFYRAMTIAADGWNISRADNANFKYYGDRSYFQLAMAGNRISYQALVGRTSGQPALCMGTPIKEDPEVVGVVAACTELQTITQLVRNTKVGENGYAYLIDREGLVLAHPNLVYGVGTELTDLRDYPPVKNILLGEQSGYFSFRDDNGNKFISYSLTLDNGWAVVLEMPSKDFNASIWNFQKNAVTVGAVAVIAMVAIVSAIAARLIRPISQLTAIAIDISERNLDQKIKMTASAELGALANAFNQMATKLKNSFDTLEEKVAERTASLEEAKGAVERASSAKDRFLASISDRLRNPLNSILGYAQILLKSDLTSEQKKSVEVVFNNTERLALFIDEILDFSDGHHNQIELAPRQFNLQILLAKIVQQFEILAKNKNIEFSLLCARDLPTLISTDPLKLERILENLLDNAIKFTENGQITFRVTKNPQKPQFGTLSTVGLRFAIADTGCGIPTEEQERIRKPFEQLGELEERQFGSGLGLAIVEQFLDLMGSMLQVESTVGIGSTFAFEIDVPVVDGWNNALESTENIIGYVGKRRSILVVDDKRDNRELLVKMLSPIGFHVETASNGQEMFSRLERQSPDLIILDLFMPVKTGFTSAKELRRNPLLAQIPLLIISGSIITQEMQNYLECDAYLSKPIDEPKLLALLEENLSIHWIKSQNQERKKALN